MKKIGYYISKFRERVKKIFSTGRIKKYGMSFAIYDFIIFLCHRSSSSFYLWIVRKKDKKTQNYLYENYKFIINQYKG